MEKTHIMNAIKSPRGIKEGDKTGASFAIVINHSVESKSALSGAVAGLEPKLQLTCT